MTADGKGKGKGKAVAPRCPPKPSSGPPKSAAGGFAPNMKSSKCEEALQDKLDGVMLLAMALEAQLEDGSIPAEGFVEKVSKYLKPEKRALVEPLLEKDAVFCTVAYLHAFTRFVEARGGDPESARAEAVAMLSSKSPLETKCIEAAEAWVVANSTDDAQEILARTWVDIFVAFPQFTSGTKNFVSEEDRVERDKLMREKAKEMEERRQASEAHWQTLSSAPITNVPWESCQRTMHVGGGSGGCLLVELRNSSAICLKPQKMNAVSEYMAEHILKALGVPVASCRPVIYRSSEFRTLVTSLKKAPVMIEGQRAKVHNVLTGMSTQHIDVEFVGVLEFVAGHSLVGMEAHNALAGENALEIYRSIGKMCAADVLINNLDRVPLPIWNNDGNLSNVIVKKSGEVIAIDQQVNIIVGPAREVYVSKLRKLVAESPEGAGSAAAVGIRRALRDNTATEASAEDMDALMAELRKEFEHIAQLWNAGTLEAAIAAGVADAKGAFATSWTDIGLTRVEAMGDFVRCTAAAVSAALGNSA